ncbi:MAG: DUF11 domain-containing protein [Clostridia bacterium]|nr:DUF11 domain-containing protein [Clostridia bacterium]
MPFINRYSDVKKGGIAFIGNTLGLSKATNLNAPGTQGSIGAFTSLDTSLQVGLFPAGTTLDYTKNGSNAILTLPAGSSVLYAELVWGGLYRSSANNISSLINNSVTFTTPSGAHTVAPDATTSQTFTIPAGNVTVGFYVRSAEVTSFVQTGGTYSVQGVPALIEAIDDRTADTNHAGWTLAVVYEDPTATLRNLTLWCGGTVVSPESGSTTITVTDFITPEVLPVSGKIFVSAQEGDAVLEGDQMLFGPNTSSLVALSGSNNPEDNFFASQINNANGVLVTTGTFGTRNANAATGTNTVACRQGWDITAVDVSNQLAVNQTSAAIRFTSDGDLYVPNALALQVDSKGADLQVTKSADKTYANVGEEITYTVVIENTGEVEAQNVTLTDLLPPETTLVANSIEIDGVAYAGTLPVTIAQLDSGASVTVTFKVTANALPAQNPIFNIARVDYEFFPFAGYPAESFSNSNAVAVYIIERSMTNVKSVDKGLAVQGDTLTYTSTITNTGSVPVANLFFTDAIPADTTFVNGSVYIDGVNYPTYNPQVGFLVANLMPQASATITFQVKIN